MWREQGRVAEAKPKKFDGQEIADSMKIAVRNSLRLLDEAVRVGDKSRIGTDIIIARYGN